MENKDTIIKLYDYDGTTGEWIRHLKSSNIITIAPTLASSAVATGDNTLASTTTDSTHVLYLVEYSVSSTTANGVGCITSGNSTYLSTLLTAADRFNVSNRRDSPLLKVPVSTTVGLHFNATTAGIVTGYAVFVKEPIRSKVETE